MTIYACIINMVKNQRALVKRTSQMLKNGQDVSIQNGEWYWMLQIE